MVIESTAKGGPRPHTEILIYVRGGSPFGVKGHHVGLEGPYVDQ